MRRVSWPAVLAGVCVFAALLTNAVGYTGDNRLLVESSVPIAIVAVALAMLALRDG